MLICYTILVFAACYCGIVMKGHIVTTLKFQMIVKIGILCPIIEKMHAGTCTLQMEEILQALSAFCKYTMIIIRSLN